MIIAITVRRTEGFNTTIGTDHAPHNLSDAAFPGAAGLVPYARTNRGLTYH